MHSLVSPFSKGVKRKFTLNSNNPEFIDFIRRLDPLQARHLSARWVGALKNWIPRFEAAQRIHLSPVIIQGDLDETVDWRHNLNIIEDKFKSPEVHLLSGARHQLANESQEFRQRINAIIDKYLA